MIRFTKIRPPMVRKAKKSQAGQDALNKLNDFIDAESPMPAFFLTRMWSDQQKAITYKELRQAIVNGYMDESTLDAWQQDYSVYVNRYLAPSWYKAMEAAAGDLSIAGSSFRYDPMWTGITDWVRNHTAQFVTNSSDEQRKAISALVARAYNNGESAEELSRAIRPCIGLTQRQAAANRKYYEHIRTQLLENNPTMREATAANRAQEAAAKYAEKQHRYRAQVIAETEMAYAYNEGHYQAVKMAQAQGLLGEVHKVWSTAADEQVCAYCGGLEGMEIDADDKFCVTNGKRTSFVLYPPAHPSCRCAFMEKEVAPPVNVAGYMEGEKGLGAGDGTSGVSEHDPPEYLGTLDDLSEEMIQSTLRKYEKEIVDSDIENAVVITKQGAVWRCYGNKNNVYPNVDLGAEALQGAWVTHNHPIGETHFTFSKDDLNLFIDYGLDLLHGCDAKYIYEFSKDASQVDEQTENWATVENFEHCRMIEFARSHGIGYRRWNNDTKRSGSKSKRNI